MSKIDWSKKNIVKINTDEIITDDSMNRLDSDNPEEQQKEIKKLRNKIEPWLSALFQSEHLSLLVGAGLTIGVNSIAECEAQGMDKPSVTIFKDEIEKKAIESSERTGRGTPNIEDYFRVMFEVLKGIEIIGHEKHKELKSEINKNFCEFYNGVVRSERVFIKKLNNTTKENKSEQLRAEQALLYLKSFLLSFSARAASRERLNIFSTNYERFIEYALDDAGVLWLDRFWGKLNPRFRNTRLELDYHYNPPGIRGEPRYVEGVIKYTKLHGSIDWKLDKKGIFRTPYEFGKSKNLSEADNPIEKVIIYPNSSKDVETALYPYAELFRDLSASVCRPNSVVVIYGYGFGDDHINRILEDMLTIPSTHLLIISFNSASGRIERFLSNKNMAQISLLIGEHFAKLENLVDNFLPKPAIDKITQRMVKLKEQRMIIEKGNDKTEDKKVGVENE